MLTWRTSIARTGFALERTCLRRRDRTLGTRRSRKLLILSIATRYTYNPCTKGSQDVLVNKMYSMNHVNGTREIHHLLSSASSVHCPPCSSMMTTVPTTSIMSLVVMGLFFGSSYGTTLFSYHGHAQVGSWCGT